MERLIKFRAWHKKRKKMYKVLHLHIESETWATCEGFDIIENKGIHIRIQPKEGVIMQFTGIKDSQQREVYEGDIIKVGLKVMPVKYQRGGFYTPYNNSNYRLGGWDTDVMNIIGNLYENPELIKAPADERSVATMQNQGKPS